MFQIFVEQSLTIGYPEKVFCQIKSNDRMKLEMLQDGKIVDFGIREN